MSASIPPESDRPPRVLIADDNQQGLELLEAYLGETDYDVETAADGEEDAAQSQGLAARPDSARCDDAPDQRFRGVQRFADPATRNLAILMVTARPTQRLGFPPSMSAPMIF